MELGTRRAPLPKGQKSVKSLARACVHTHVCVRTFTSRALRARRQVRSLGSGEGAAPSLHYSGTEAKKERRGLSGAGAGSSGLRSRASGFQVPFHTATSCHSTPGPRTPSSNHCLDLQSEESPFPGSRLSLPSGAGVDVQRPEREGAFRRLHVLF